jgi:hypothetical protein
VPQGDLYALLERYSEETRGLLVNDAHDYLPHCTLTSFFTLPSSAPNGSEAEAVLLRRLTAALQSEIAASLDEPPSSSSSAWAWVEGLYDKDEAIGLAVQAPRIVAAMQRLADAMKNHDAQGDEAGGGVVIVPKTRLHISMAYGDGVTRAKAPELYSLAHELEAKRCKDSSPSSWRVELLRQEVPQHTKRPEMWMRSPLWSFSPG